MRISPLLPATALLLAAGASSVAAAPQPLTIITLTAQDVTQSLQTQIFEMLHNPSDYFSSIWGSASSTAQSGWAAAREKVDSRFPSQPAVNDVCPDLKVSCMKDGKKVGDIGKKPFCWNRDDDDSFKGSLEYLGIKDGEQKWIGNPKAIGCAMCEPTKNDAECNLKHAVDCAAQCKASGPLGGH